MMCRTKRKVCFYYRLCQHHPTKRLPHLSLYGYCKVTVNLLPSQRVYSNLTITVRRQMRKAFCRVHAAGTTQVCRPWGCRWCHHGTPKFQADQLILVLPSQRVTKSGLKHFSRNLSELINVEPIMVRQLKDSAVKLLFTYSCTRQNFRHRLLVLV